MLTESHNKTLLKTDRITGVELAKHFLLLRLKESRTFNVQEGFAHLHYLGVFLQHISRVEER